MAAKKTDLTEVRIKVATRASEWYRVGADTEKIKRFLWVWRRIVGGQKNL